MLSHRACLVLLQVAVGHGRRIRLEFEVLNEVKYTRLLYLFTRDMIMGAYQINDYTSAAR